MNKKKGVKTPKIGVLGTTRDSISNKSCSKLVEIARTFLENSLLDFLTFYPNSKWDIKKNLKKIKVVLN